MTDAEVKEEVRKRDGYRCVECGVTQADYSKRLLLWGGRQRGARRLDVHRKIADGPYSLENCETLCRSCHCTRRRDYEHIGLGPRGFRLHRQDRQWDKTHVAPRD